MREWTFLAVGLVCLLLGSAASPTLAQDYYGAIAYSRSTGAHGWAYDYATQREAEDSALSECRRHARDCTIALWFRNACGALAVGSDDYGAGWGRSRGHAEREALRSCRRTTGGCSIKRWVCTSRVAASGCDERRRCGRYSSAAGPHAEAAVRDTASHRGVDRLARAP